MTPMQELNTFIKSKSFKRHWKSFRPNQRPLDKYQALRSFHETPAHLLTIIDDRSFQINNILSNFRPQFLVEMVEEAFYGALVEHGYDSDVIDLADIVMEVRLVQGDELTIIGPDVTHYELDIVTTDGVGDVIEPIIVIANIVPNDLGMKFEFELGSVPPDNAHHAILDDDEGILYHIRPLNYEAVTTSTTVDNAFKLMVVSALVDYFEPRATVTDLPADMSVREALTIAFRSTDIEISEEEIDGTMTVTDVVRIPARNSDTCVNDTVKYNVVVSDDLETLVVDSDSVTVEPAPLGDVGTTWTYTYQRMPTDDDMNIFNVVAPIIFPTV